VTAAAAAPDLVHEGEVTEETFQYAAVRP